MAPKRKAQDAFGKPNGQLSAVAAARLAKQRKNVDAVVETAAEEEATQIGASTYDAHHDDSFDAGLRTEREDVLVTGTDGPTNPDMALSSYNDNSVSLDSEAGFEVKLRTSQYVTAVGEYDIEVLQGTVSIYGATLSANSGFHRVCAPTNQAVPTIVARKDGTRLKLHPVQPYLRKLEGVSPLYRGLWSKEDRSFTITHSSTDDNTRAIAALEIEKDAEAVVSKLCGKAHSGGHPRIMAIGTKSSGKSTFTRVLVNSLLSRTQRRKCFYLDLDPGQPEFGAPGTVSLVEVSATLLGPPFSHIATRHSKQYRLVRSHALAATSFKDDPDHYLACAKDLVRHAGRSFPIIVNSCGWVSGLGAAVLIDLANALEVTDAVVFNPVEESVVDSMNKNVDVHNLNRRPTKPSLRSPAENRTMLTLAYFHHRLRKDVQSWKGSSIDTWKPWIVSFSEEANGIHGILSYGQLPQPEFLGEVLEGSIVALVTCTEDPDRQSTPEGLPYILPNDQGYTSALNPNSSECVGLALVRGIDAENQELHLVAPLEEEDIAGLMQKRVLLVRGGFDPADWAYLETLYLNPDDTELERPWVSRREMVGIEGAVWRLRHPPVASAPTAR